MAEPRTHMASHDALIDLSERALASEEGVHIRFTVTPERSLEACAIAARSFQKVWTSLRARARRMTQARDANLPGPYDRLSCTRLPLPNGEGWQISLVHATAVLASFDVVDIATGERIALGAGKRERLIEKALTFPHLWTDSDQREALELDPAFFTLPDGGTWSVRGFTPQREPNLASVGLADLDPEVDIFTGERLDTVEGGD